MQTVKQDRTGSKTRRKEEFEKHFRVLYGVHKGTFDFRDDTLFYDTLDWYYKMSDRLESDEFSDFMKRFMAFFPTPEQWKNEMNEFMSRAKPPPKDERTPLQRKTDKSYAWLQSTLIPQYWPLLCTPKGKILFARLWRFGCHQGHLELNPFFGEILKGVPGDNYKDKNFKEKLIQEISDEMKTIPVARSMLGYI